ncbi:hypothetical protein A8E16_30470 [Burkholderia cenocepacia]|nr:hypothetical protein A8E16_30470 [Burkholderia cenocepacia]
MYKTDGCHRETFMGTTTSLVQAAPAPLRVLIAVDGSSASAHAIAYAKALLPSNAAVHIIRETLINSAWRSSLTRPRAL